MVKLKDKALLLLPYLFLALFFVGIIFLNLNGNLKEPICPNEGKTEIDLPMQAVTETSPDEPEEDEEAQTESKTETVIIDEIQESSKTVTDCYYTRYGTKFHSTPDCRYLKNSPVVIRTSYDNVEKLNLTPCSGCVG